MSFHVPNKYRIRSGRLKSNNNYGNNGYFLITTLKPSPLKVIASDGDGWEHVSVSLHNRCPTWDEMCLIKKLFWDDNDFVIQIHPPKTHYMNTHPYCLHLWRKKGTNDFCQKPDISLI